MAGLMFDPKDGHLVSRKDYIESKNWEGGDHKEEKIEIMKLRVSMRPIEKAAYDEFVASDAAKKYVNNKEIAQEKRLGRKTLLENTALKELLYLRSIDRKRQEDKKPLLTKEDYHLSLTNEGVVISRYREKEQRESELQAEKDRTSAALEAMGGRASDIYDY